MTSLSTVPVPADVCLLRDKPAVLWTQYTGHGYIFYVHYTKLRSKRSSSLIPSLNLSPI